VKQFIFRSIDSLLIRISATHRSRSSIFHATCIRCSILLKYMLANALFDILNIGNFTRLKKARNTKSQIEALVLGNGPSLAKISFPKVKNLQKMGLEVFVVNYFPLFENTENITPNYLVLSDSGTRPSNKEERSGRLWNWIRENESVTLCVPYSWKREVEIITENVIYFNDSGVEGIFQNINPIFPRSYASLTAYKALSLSLYFGYNKISILGIDNSNYRNLLFTANNDVLQQPFHFGPYGTTVNFTQTLGMNASRYFLDLAQILEDLEMFKSDKLVNLDCESVIDSFKKFADYRFLNEDN